MIPPPSPPETAVGIWRPSKDGILRAGFRRSVPVLRAAREQDHACCRPRRTICPSLQGPGPRRAGGVAVGKLACTSHALGAGGEQAEESRQPLPGWA
ncbi:hypothetical protein CDD83_5960 [Cordyceps sp. RAO-2017]|nr:hypothetical protein CDD83_5960 [Cordyceps sp. RAO-2017]